MIIWALLVLALAVPLLAAAASPLLAWRAPVYVLAGFSGIIAFGLMLVQPLLVSGFLPGLGPRQARRTHRIIGISLILGVVTHVIALWITSPPDVVDALLLVSPTPFSLWGVIAMWAVFAAGALVVLRRPLRLRWSHWRNGHIMLVVIAVAGTVAHVLLIEGTMEFFSKLALCVLVALALITALVVLRRQRP